ncbi:DUF3325 domain-containing protein [Azomonas macrocytogenes]|uniref:DUF3325 domain-containing protein n=1 Tax=Azomonas macrocytogenes TaxID=69962 RepID=A0A839T2T8_AZOMA|nr:DUF3325 domain-containing protein [Azomonas macrocytogenes]MBB3103851.1 hypothetical protein [Azomonas macrocytogenes]
MIWPSLALCFSGFAALCLAMNRHYGQVFGTDAPADKRLPLQIGGWLMLAFAIFVCIDARGISVGIVQWIVQLTLAALALVLLLAYRPRLIVPLALVAPPVALLSLLFR